MKRILISMFAALMCVMLLAVSASAAGAQVEYTLSSEKTYPGGTVEITISIDSSAEGNTYALAGFTYDSDVFEFVGFSDFEAAISDKIVFPGMQPDSDKMAIAIPLENSEKFSGNICTMTFKVDENAEYGEYEISATTLVAKNNSDVLETAVVPATVTVKEQTVPVEGISLDRTQAYVNLGESTTLFAALTPADTTETNITWTSSDEDVATVENGVVTAHGKGSATITATAENGASATCKINVDVFADAVKFSAIKYTSLAVGKTMSFKASAYREDGKKPASTKVVYEIVSGEEFATIDAKGKLTALDFGEVTVRARAEAGTDDAYADAVIRVCIPAKKVTISKTKAAMALGYGDLQLTATMTDETNTDTLTWSVDKPEIATVDENGLVTAHAVGKAKITAMSGSGKKATCTVTVGEPATRVDLTSLKATSVAPGKNITLKGKAACEGKTKPVSTAVVFEILDGEEYATIDAKGKLVAGNEEGTIVVRVRAEAGTEEAYEDVEIRVCKNLATKVTLNMTKASMVLGSGELELSATMVSKEGECTDTLRWTVDKPEIATVDENGVVTAHAAGKVKVTAMAGSGKSASCSITVGVPATGVDISSTKTTSVAPGKNITLKGKAVRDDKTKPVSTNVVFEIIEGENLATIDAKGKFVAGDEEGTVVVRISAEVGTEDAYEDVEIRICTLATKVTLNMTKATVSLSDGELQLEATVIPEESTDTLTWSVDKPEIATVDENGLVTVHSVGKAKVTATTGSGKKATCTVTVTE